MRRGGAGWAKVRPRRARRRLNPNGCGAATLLHGENHTCTCAWPGCDGTDHICMCGYGWQTEEPK